MCSRKIPSLLCCLILPVLLLMACNGLFTGPKQEDVKYVPLLPVDKMVTFRLDSTNLSNIANNKAPAASALSKAGAVTVKINPTKIMIMSVVSTHSSSGDTALQRAYSMYWQTYWKGRSYNKWDDEVGFYQNSPQDQILYMGELARDGNYATGKVAVRKGETSVLVGFIMPGDTLWNYSMSWATYSWGDTAYEDGWYTSARYGVKQDTVRFQIQQAIAKRVE
jgi:hypothetical protein